MQFAKVNISHFISNVLLLLFGRAEITHIWETQFVFALHDDVLFSIYQCRGHSEKNSAAVLEKSNLFKSQTEIE